MTFDDFWSTYPRKIGKGAARQSYSKALKKISPERIMIGLSQSMAHWAAEGTEKTFIPHASTWLNQERWEDEYETPASDLDKVVRLHG